jgi:hypothetical protein
LASSAASSGSANFELRTLHSELTRLIHAGTDEQTFLTSLMELVRRLTSAQWVRYFRTRSEVVLELGPNALTTGASEPCVFADAMATCAASARQQARLVVSSLENNCVALGVPVTVAPQQTDALCMVVRAEPGRVDPIALVLQLVAGHVTLWHSHQASCELDVEAANSAALLEVLSEVARSAEATSAAQLLVEQACRYLAAQRVALGLIAPGAKACRLIAVSGVTDLDPHATVSKLFEAVLNETLLRDEPGVWPIADDAVRHLLAAHRQLSEALGGAHVYSTRLYDADGNPVGAWAFVGSKESAFDLRRIGFLHACTATIGEHLALVRRSEPDADFRRLFDRLRLRRLLSRRWVAALLATTAGALMVPVSYPVSCPCVIEPVVRRYVAAPFAGTFDKSLVKPGDVVRRDQVLGRLDGREVRWEMAGLIADQNRAAKSRDVNMAAGKIAAAQIDKLEMERLEQKKRLLTHRLENLEVKSPIDGIVISGDLEKSVGVPLTVGQVLYEVAPLDRMVAEVAVADEDRSYVQTDHSVRIKLDAFGSAAWNGRVERIDPRSELREEANVFIAESTLDNADGALRPGMKGSAKIKTDSRPLGWIIVHKPWNKLLGWMGW